MGKHVEMTGASGRVSIDLTKIEQPDFVAVCRRYNIKPKIFPLIEYEGTLEVDLSTVDEGKIAAAYEGARVSGQWLELVYRALAENDCEAAMEELYRQFGSFGLAPPSHARRVIDCIQGFKGIDHVQN